MIRKETTQEMLRYVFTEDELKDRSRKLAHAVQTKTAIEEEKKSAMAQFKERIDGEKALIGKLSRDINNGWEMRSIDCAIAYNVPNTGFKTITRSDTKEVVKEVQMTQDELQEKLFEEPADPAADSEAAVASFFGTGSDTPVVVAPEDVPAPKEAPEPPAKPKSAKEKASDALDGTKTHAKKAAKKK